MKKIYALFIALIMCNILIAQDFNDYLEVSREVLKAEKKELIMDVMQFTSEESQAFWPLYNEYEQKKYQVDTKRFNMIQKFAENYETMSDQAASEIISEALAIDMERAKLDKAYAKKFLKILSPQRTVRYLQAERKIEALINAEISLQVPLLDEIED